MLTQKTERQEKLIINNVLRACKDINSLNSSGYDFLYLSSGFIAHYNRHGFIHNYNEPGSLRRAILRYESMNTWDNFRPGERDYEYYHQKGAIYSRIVQALKKFDGVQAVFAG